MPNPLPAHLAHRQQSFDAFFNFDEGAEILDLADAAGDRRADGVFVLGADPGVGHHLLEAQTELAGFRIDANDFHIDDIADFDELTRFDPAAVGDFADVKQAVDAAQIDEGAVIHDAAHRTAADLALG